MNIAQAKDQVKDTVEAYLATDDSGRALMETARQRPIFLVGAPGIGKTAIMEQVAQELGIGIVSYSMTHHTRQSALGLPFIVHRSFGDFEYDASEYTMSEIIASVYEYMNRTKIDRGILFLDEINCVSETLYPSMLQFLQFKTFGRHQVPAGWIIVTAGNPPEYNSSVHEFDIVTLDRIKKITVEPDFEVWKAYATDKGLHPAVVTFLSIKKDRFYSVESTVEGKRFVTARGWEDLSNIIQIYEKLDKAVDYDLVSQYVQNDRIAREFATYYELFNKYKSDYRIDDILAGRKMDDIVVRAGKAQFDERLSLVGLLLDSLTTEMAAVTLHEDVLMGQRDALRSLKNRLGEGKGKNADADPLALLRDDIQQRSIALDAAVASNSITDEKRTIQRGIIQNLIALVDASDKAERDGSKKGFDAIQDCYTKQTAALKPEADAVEQKIANAFKFMELTFGDAQEMLVFVTELTTRPKTSRFISHFGSASYFAHNNELMIEDKHADIQRRIDALKW